MEWLRRAKGLGDMMAAMKLEELEKQSDEDLLHQLQSSSMVTEVPVGIGFTDSLSDDYCQHVPAVRAAAERGSTIAAEVLTVWACMQVAMEAFKQGNTEELIGQLSRAIRIDFQLIEMPVLFVPALKKGLETHPNELESIVCQVLLYKKDPFSLRLFLDNFLNKFPTDLFLLEMSAINYSYLGADKEALEVLDTALELYPNNVRLLYIRANKLKMDGSAWDKFLALAPKDHPKVPTAYYRKAYCGNPNNPNPHKLVECYEKGLAAEKDQLPCFLPYDFPPKYRLEKLCSAVKTNM